MSDAIDWPEIFAQRNIGRAEAWQESAPGCWSGIGEVDRIDIVVDEGSKLIVTMLNARHHVPDARAWFRLHDALADLLRSRGYEVTCAVDGCEYRWPCPRREAYAYLGAPGEGGAAHRPKGVRTDG